MPFKISLVKADEGARMLSSSNFRYACWVVTKGELQDQRARAAVMLKVAPNSARVNGKVVNMEDFVSGLAKL